MDSATLAGQIADYDTKNKVTSADALNEALGKYGVPEIRNRVSGLRTTLANTESALNSVDPSVTGRTQGSLVTEAQRQRQVVNERAPIAQQYGDQERALGVESGNLADANTQATSYATNRVNDYVTGRGALQSQYDTAYKREQDAIANALAQRQLDEQIRSARESASSAGGYNLGAGVSGAPTAPTPATDPIHQAAYNDVKTRVTTQSAAELMSDYQATARSAKNGNQKDLAKLQLYRQLRPDLFKAKYSWEK
jgi:uncharacterized small protein (DUF1192 family)